MYNRYAKYDKTTFCDKNVLIGKYLLQNFKGFCSYKKKKMVTSQLLNFPKLTG